MIDSNSSRALRIIGREIICSIDLLMSCSSSAFSFVIWIVRIILLMILCSILLLGVHVFVLNKIVVMNFIINLLLLNWVFLRTANLRVLRKICCRYIVLHIKLTLWILYIYLCIELESLRHLSAWLFGHRSFALDLNYIVKIQDVENDGQILIKSMFDWD